MFVVMDLLDQTIDKVVENGSYVEVFKGVSDETLNETKMATVRYATRFRKALNVESKRIDNYRILAWYGVHLHWAADDKSGVILAITLHVMNDQLQRDVGAGIDNNTMNMLYRMVTFRGSPPMKTYSIHFNGLLMAFWTAARVAEAAIAAYKEKHPPRT